jgi:hypothetical protein
VRKSEPSLSTSGVFTMEIASNSRIPLPGQMTFGFLNEEPRRPTMTDLDMPYYDMTDSQILADAAASGEVVRLGCFACDESDEFITHEQLQAHIAAGWRCIVEIQTLAESIDTENCTNLLDFETHRGFCPSCWESGERLEHPLPSDWKPIPASWEGV